MNWSHIHQFVDNSRYFKIPSKLLHNLVTSRCASRQPKFSTQSRIISHANVLRSSYRSYISREAGVRHGLPKSEAAVRVRYNLSPPLAKLPSTAVARLSSDKAENCSFRPKPDGHIYRCLCGILPTQFPYIDELNKSRKVSRLELTRRIKRVQGLLKKTEDSTELAKRPQIKRPLFPTAKMKRARPPRRSSEPVLRTKPDLNWRKQPLIAVGETRTSMMRRIERTYCGRPLQSALATAPFPVSLSQDVVHRLVQRKPTPPVHETRSSQLRKLDGSRKRQATDAVEPPTDRPPFEPSYRMLKYKKPVSFDADSRLTSAPST